jgi:DNA topoisomerase-1
MWKVADLQTKTASRYPKPPFTTSTLQQAAANQLGMTSSRTMRTAQRLYEAGNITYMRTDSVHLAEEAVANIRKYIDKEIGKEYLPVESKHYASNSKLTQEAHEAIRPTHVEKSVEELKLNGDQERLYRLIWKRAVACQMNEAKLEMGTAIINVGKYTFQANGQRILFPGFLKIYTDKVKEAILPKLEVGQELFLEKLEADQHFTQPPARYSEASLIKEMEALGIGRPSTYAPTISTILARKYVEKEGKYFKPTVTGKIVTRLLVKHFPEIVDLNFTAGMEEDLDKIADGKLDWQKLGIEFFKKFDREIKEQESKIDKKDYTVLGTSKEKCPVCGKAMVIKLGRFGTFLSCVDFPKCKGMMSLNSKGETSLDLAKKTKTKDFQEKYKPAPQTDDGRDYQLKTGRFGYFWAHPDYPKVKDARPLDLVDQLFAKIYGKAPKASDGKVMVLRRGKFGEFWSHPDYPQVKEITKLDVKKVREAKKQFSV